MAGIIDTKPSYRVFSAITEMHGPQLSDLADCCRLPRSDTRRILNKLIASGLVQEVQRRFYATNGGVAEVARHNRSHFQSVKRLIASAPASGRTNTPILDKRDRAVNQAHRHFQAEGFGVYNGRRMGIGLLGQWFPDLWVNIRAESVGHKPVWHAVLVDPSTRSLNAIKTILRDYRSAWILDPEEFPLLVIARDEVAAEHFRQAGDDLTVMIAPYKAFLKGPHSGPDSVWRYRGQVADVNRLAEIMLFRQSTYWN